jgi:hypothetical protein
MFLDTPIKAARAAFATTLMEVIAGLRRKGAKANDQTTARRFEAIS